MSYTCTHIPGPPVCLHIEKLEVAWGRGYKTEAVVSILFIAHFDAFL